MSVLKLKDKVCIVTGSTCGVGEAIARLFLEQGAFVMVTGLPNSLTWDINKYSGRVYPHYCDLSDGDTPRELVDVVLREFGGVDVLVNNAATMERSNSSSTTMEVFDRVIAVNVRAPLLLCEAAFAPLAERHGCVLNIGSINGYCGERDLLAYSISKGALHTMSRNLADAWSMHRVRVNHFVLGWVLTQNEYDRKVSDGLGPNWHLSPPVSAIPFGTMTSPDTIAHAALYWCSEDSWPLSGNTIELEQYPVIGRNPPKSNPS
jgi:NAD(P)-dependent dehydrogenase (short-subunit alcohol dehydrogenase family)